MSLCNNQWKCRRGRRRISSEHNRIASTFRSRSKVGGQKKVKRPSGAEKSGAVLDQVFVHTRSCRTETRKFDANLVFFREAHYREGRMNGKVLTLSRAAVFCSQGDLTLCATQRNDLVIG
jgi:hypothetical protein